MMRYICEKGLDFRIIGFKFMNIDSINILKKLNLSNMYNSKYRDIMKFNLLFYIYDKN